MAKMQMLSFEDDDIIARRIKEESPGYIEDPDGLNRTIRLHVAPTVYKKHWLWDKELWSYPGSGFAETVHFGVEWLSEESFRFFYEDVRDDKYNEDFTITIP